MLEYENELLIDSVQENQLCIFAKGIPIQGVLTDLFRTYASETNLVFVLSTNGNEEQYYLDQLKDDKAMSITTEFSASDRKELYSKGGVFFVTSRILVVDFLKDVIPAEKITGVIVLRAHNVVENSQEAFILRLYRSKNKTGFIKAFSHSPTAFILGASKMNRVMRCCFLKNLSLWPRFHSTIKESLARAPPDVVEIQLRLTESMKEIQASLLDLISWSLSELKRLIPALNDEEVTVETALTKGFEKIIGAYVDPVWNTISAKSKDIMNDLKIFRLLLRHLTKSDCITFFSTLCLYTSKEAAFKSSWVLTKAAEQVIVASKARLFPPIDAKKSADIPKKSTDVPKKSTGTTTRNFDPEIHPKWLALSEILNEISIKKENSEESKVDSFAARLKTLIFAEDAKTCGVLKDYLCHGSDATLAKISSNYDNIKVNLPPELVLKLDRIYRANRGIQKFVHEKKGAKSGAAGSKDSIDSEEANKTNGPTEIQVTLTQIERKYEEIEFLQTPIFIRPLKNLGDSEAFAVCETLEKLRPDVIIIFDPNLELVRNIEVHRARMAESQDIKVYFLSFHNSVEEQIYLTSIQREKYAFEKLIEEKTIMVVPNDREARDEINQDLWRDPSKANETVAAGTQSKSKRNMENETPVQHIILVDMREFRSELPSLIHKRGIDLEPITLDVGDYILTPEICVERKSISDLIGSLNSGRMYKQAEAMTRHYKKPVLLIEQEQQSQTVAAGIRYRNDLAQIMPKLQILTMQFPKLKFIWSPGAHYTSELFHELKRGKDQPDPEKALGIQKESTGSHSTSRFNPVSHSFLSKMPGVDSRNVYALLGRCESLDHICRLKENELSSILENSQAASVLYSGLHSKLLSEGTGVPEDDKAKNAAKPVSTFRVGMKSKTTRGGRKN